MTYIDTKISSYMKRNVATNLALMNNLALAFINIAQEVADFKTKKFARKTLVMDAITYHSK